MEVRWTWGKRLRCWRLHPHREWNKNRDRGTCQAGRRDRAKNSARLYSCCAPALCVPLALVILIPRQGRSASLYHLNNILICGLYMRTTVDLTRAIALHAAREQSGNRGATTLLREGSQGVRVSESKGVIRLERMPKRSWRDIRNGSSCAAPQRLIEDNRDGRVTPDFLEFCVRSGSGMKRLHRTVFQPF